MAVARTTQAGQRRLVYGVNVAVQVVLALTVVIGAVALTRNVGQADLSQSGINSLTPRTQRLLAGLERDVRISAIYTVLSEYDELAQKRQDMVRDLLRLYDMRGGGRVTARVIDPMKDRAQLPALLERLREKPAYAGESEPHRQVIEQFSKLNAELLAALDGPLTQLQERMQAQSALQDALVQIVQEISSLRQQASLLAADIAELSAADIPRYGEGVESVRSYLTQLQSWLQGMSDLIARRLSADPALRESAGDVLEEAAGAFDRLRAPVGELLEQARDLEPVELESLADELGRWPSAPPIVVETDERAEVLSFGDVWPMRADRNAPPPPDGDPREFAGEQAVSSAILRLTQSERTAVVFVRFGGTPLLENPMAMMMQAPPAPFSALNELLGSQNFIVREWDVKTEKEAPQIEDAARTVYVVLPPTPPEQTNPMRPAPEAPMSPEDAQLVTDALAQRGMAVFLVGWQPPQSSPMPGMPAMPPPPYIYADYLRETWGLTVETGHLALQFMPTAQETGGYQPTANATFLTTAGRTSGARFTDHPIVAPLKSQPAGFPLACPLVPVDGGPATVTPLVEVESGSDVWAVADTQRVNEDLRASQATRPHEGDLEPPFAIAVAAEKEGGQRLVVVASEYFMTDRVLEMIGRAYFRGNALVFPPAYPGNSDFFLNAVHWLTNEADRISVGTRRVEVPRLDKLEEGFWTKFWQVFLVGVWPGLALVVGGGVWLMRRR